MAGKILPIALATISGISIGVATFGPELKEQRKKKLTEDYNRDVAAAAALNGEGPPSIVPSVTQPRAVEQIPTNAHTEQDKPSSSSWSSMLGLWAWKKKSNGDALPAALASPAVAQEAPSKTTTQQTNAKP